MAKFGQAADPENGGQAGLIRRADGKNTALELERPRKKSREKATEGDSDGECAGAGLFRDVENATDSEASAHEK